MSVMAKQEHPDLSDVEWDPTGRYVTSSVNLWNAKVYIYIYILKFRLFMFGFFFYLISVIIHLKYGRFKVFWYLKKLWKNWSLFIGVHDHHHFLQKK